jgi:ABC-2 type transport system ATP-binding protein
MSDVAISTAALGKYYRKTRAVDGLNLRVPRGAVYGLLGRNGAGKTTTIRMLMGLTRPSVGSFQVLDMQWPHDQLAMLQRVAYVGERKLLFDSMTGRELLRFNRPFFAGWSDELANTCVQSLEIPLERPFKELSRGNQTKLCLLMAVAQGAELLIIDEPTSGLDPVAQDELLKLLIDEFAGKDRTVFLSSHHLAELERVADWIGIIDQGKLLLEARLDDIRSGYRRVTATGNVLSAKDERVISAVQSGSTCDYVLRNESERFVAELRSQGATIVNVSPLNLSDIFLHLVRKEEPCTPGNVGATPVVSS